MKLCPKGGSTAANRVAPAACPRRPRQHGSTLLAVPPAGRQRPRPAPVNNARQQAGLFAGRKYFNLDLRHPVIELRAYLCLDALNVLDVAFVRYHVEIRPDADYPSVPIHPTGMGQQGSRCLRLKDHLDIATSFSSWGIAW